MATDGASTALGLLHLPVPLKRDAKLAAVAIIEVTIRFVLAKIV